MKKKISLLIAAALLMSAFCATGAAAGAVKVTDSYGNEYEIGSDVLTVKFNGEAVVFPDAQPFIDGNNRTMIPLRAVTETMGADVDWNQDSQTAVIEQNGITIMVPVGSETISVTKDGVTSTVTMDTQAVLANNRTYVPIRFVAESLGAWVSYSDLFSTVQIYKDVLTPEEITRLHSYYDMTWEEHCNEAGYESTSTDEDRVASYPQIVYFTGSYGFENANEWKLRNPNGIEVLKQPLRTPTNYVGVISGLTYTYGKQPDIDFANLILAEANAVADEINSAGKVTITLRTDLSCVYFSRHSNAAGTYVRGVLTVNIPENANISWIKENYDFISDPKAGETRDVDVEIYVDTFTANVHWSSMTAIK
ncbi:hypothetical protein SDC9_54447 [bioreactor metagenome]|uniref:Copper amine oxidase-like N-terminal domain-containing protein n=1 Tax=bioreactor metagenome TaxID=1076179 RepID=A0A644WW35_9ZZZZ